MQSVLSSEQEESIREKELASYLPCSGAIRLQQPGCAERWERHRHRRAEADLIHQKGTAPISGRTARMQECMRAAGVEAEYSGRGGLESSEKTTEQSDLWEEVFWECAESQGLNRPWTEDELREPYQLELKNHDCLITAGYESGDPTSEQAYIDAWHQGTEPYQSIGLVGDNRQDPALFFEATQACPAPLWNFGD